MIEIIICKNRTRIKNVDENIFIRNENLVKEEEEERKKEQYEQYKKDFLERMFSQYNFMPKFASLQDERLAQ